MDKTFRAGAYSILLTEGKIILIKKSRGPFTGMYDLPGGKIEHGENSEVSILREILEELGIDDAKLVKLQNVYKYVSTHEWKGKEYCEHILGIVYVCETDKLPNMDLVDLNEDLNDSCDYIIKEIDGKLIKNYKLTPICEQAIKEYLNLKLK